jgi:hypothetical protein
MVQVLRFVQNEQCFSILDFMKNKVHNWLNTHLYSCVKMFGQTFFTLENFPYDCHCNLEEKESP